MEAIRSHFGSGWSWLRLHGFNFNSSLIFDSLAIPFTDSQFGLSSSSISTDDQTQAGSEDRVIYLDTNGRELNRNEVEEYARSAYNESPWGFVASRYALTLGIMAVVVNRISHICRPQGRPRPLPRARRLALQLPALAFLAYVTIILLLVTAHSFFPDRLSIGSFVSLLKLPQDAQILVNSSAASEESIHEANATLLWRLFLSICFTVISSTLVRTLEGNSNWLVHPDDPSNSPTFNLVGFAVLLHLHASSYTFPPNKHVYLSILFQLAEVLGMQACTCWVHQPPISRLVLTSFFGITSTVHFLVALQSGDKGYPFLQTFSRAPDVALMVVIILTVFLHALTAAITDTPLSFSRLIDPNALPSSTDDYSLALFKIGTACLSSTRLSGMDSDLIDINTGTETWVEVEGTNVTVKEPGGFPAIADMDGKGGLSREIRKIKTSRNAIQHHRSQSYHYFSSPRWREANKFITLLWRTIKAILTMAMRRIVSWLPFNLPAFPNWMQQIPRRLRLLWHGVNGEARRNVRIEEERRRRETQRLRFESDRLFRQKAEATYQARASSSAISTSIDENLQRRYRGISPMANTSFGENPTPWQQFFSQDFKDDEEESDEEWNDEIEDDAEETLNSTSNSRKDPTIGVATSIQEQMMYEGEEEEEMDGDELEEVGDLSSELLSLARVDFEREEREQGSSTSFSYTNVLMAHLSRQGEGVLTRRGYRRIIGDQSHAEEEAQHLINVVNQRRFQGDARSILSSDQERMRLCVVCYIEDRNIICWPCRCLALCEGCREAMATRPPPRSITSGIASDRGNSSTHVCPTCRTPVIGYSRLFLP